MSTTLTLPANKARQNAAIQLLVQVYVAPHLGEGLQITEGSELSLSTSTSSTAQPSSFLEIFKTLLGSTDQSAAALGGAASTSETPKTRAEHWIDAATALSTDEGVDVKSLDEVLKNKTFVAENRLTAADVAVFGNLHSYMAQASHETLLSHPNVTRHFDLLQHTTSVSSALSKLPANTFSTSTVPIDLDNVPAVERKYESSKKDKKVKAAAAAVAASTGDAKAKAGEAAPTAPAEGGKGKGKAAKKEQAAAAPAQTDASPAGGEGAEKPKKEKKDKAGKKESAAGADGAAAATAPAKGKKEKGGGGGAAPAADEPLSPGLIDLRVGHIVDVKKHPDADSLYIEQIDVGEAEPRTVVSGLVNYIPIEEMQGKYLIAVCNLKPASMRGVKSFAMVLAATSKDGKEGMGSVELVAPPEGSKPGDRVYFEGFESVKALEQLPPKKKIFETIQPGFTTLAGREAAWVSPEGKEHKIRTENGLCLAPTFVGASLS